MNATDTEIVNKIKIPALWKVVIHNDDFTPIDFVIKLLQEVFNKSTDESKRLTYMVHNNGRANIGVFTKEVALTKVSQVRQSAEHFGHPLLATAEEA